MALSSSVEESLEEAQSHLRNALAFAARNERPFVCERIAKLVADIDSVGTTDALFDSLESYKENGGEGENPFGKFGFGK